MDWIKVISSSILALLLVSVITIPTPSLALSIVNIVHENGENIVVEERTGLVVFLNISFSDMLRLAYIVRNISMPLLNWSLQYNVTLARVLIRLGNSFLERAINESSSNETRAKIYAFIAAVIYGHAPVTAYPVLARTINEHRGVNDTLTNETVLAVYNRVVDLKNLLNNAKGILVSYNLTIPPRLIELEIEANGLVNTSLELLSNGYIGRAFGYMIRAYHKYVLAYSILIRSVFVQILGIRIGPGERLAHRLVARRIAREIVERIIDKLPRTIRERIRNRVERGEIRNWEDLKRAIREEVEYCRQYISQRNIEIVSSIITNIIITIYYRGDLINKTLQSAIAQWLEVRDFLINIPGPRDMVKKEALYSFIKEHVTNVSKETSLTGLALLEEAINQLEVIIKNDIGVKVELDVLIRILVQQRRES